MPPFNDLNIKIKSKFLKIESGQPQDVRILQDTPNESIRHGFGATATNCEGNECSLCAEGHDQVQRFFVNVYNHTIKKVQVWEFGSGIAKQIKSIAKTVEEDNKSLLDVDLKIEAEGSGLSKKYKVTPRMTSKEVPEGLKLLPLDGEIPF